MHSPPLRRVALLALVLLVLIPFVSRSAYRPSLLRDLAEVAERTGTRVAPQLSVSPDDRRGLGGRTTAGPADPGVQAVARRLVEARRDGSSEEALYASALHDLIWGRTVEQAARAVADLETVLRLGGPSAGVLADLAAAHLVRAERAGAPRDLFEAVDAAAWALELEPTHAAARFNLALALHRLMLDGEAARAWRDFAAVDSTSGWGREAGARLDSLSTPAGPPPPPAGASAAQLAAYAGRAPQEARVLALDGLLGTWGEAVLRGDTAGAAADLGRAAVIARALERRRGGDASLGDAVRAIQAHAADRAATRALATAHAAYARAQPFLERRETKPARRWLETSLAHAKASPALAGWAAYSRGVALHYAGDARHAAVFRDVAARADSVRHPALAGRAQWSLGIEPLRSGAFEEARGRFVTAARLFERAGEREHLGGVQGLETEALFGLGDEDEAYASMLRAMGTLRPYRASVRLHNLLYVSAQAATAGGLKRAALRLQDEDVSVAARVRPAVHAEALLVRALTRTAAGDLRGAAADVQASRPVVASLPEGEERSWYESDLRLAASGLLLRSRPDSAVRELDRVVAFFPKNAKRLLPALVRRAEAHLAAGAVDHAVADLDRAAVALRRLTGRVGDAAVRASMLEAARGVFDRLVMLHVRAGRTDEALAALERGRASFGPAGTGEGAGGPGTFAAPPGETALEYALVGDTLLTFALSDRGVGLHTATVDRDALLRRIDRLRSDLELRVPPDSMHRDLAALYDQLVRPVRAQLGDGAPLVIVADGELGGVPFAALRDTVRGRYLVQDHRIRFASTLAGAARRKTEPWVAREPVLFVADPAFARREHPGLLRLPGLARDTRAVARGYPGSVVLADSAARRDALAAALAEATLFHLTTSARPAPTWCWPPSPTAPAGSPPTKSRGWT
jgi:hypothetical protein